jgi:hypothetical protein
MFGSNDTTCDCVYEKDETVVECMRDAVIRVDDTQYCEKCMSKAEAVTWQ